MIMAHYIFLWIQASTKKYKSNFVKKNKSIMAPKPQKNNQGGVSLAGEWKTKKTQFAFDYFMQNATFKIVTDTSISCITYRADLKPDIQSPFMCIRANNFRQPIRSILIKVMLHGTYSIRIPDKNLRTNGFEMTDKAIELEIKNQKFQDFLKAKEFRF